MKKTNKMFCVICRWATFEHLFLFEKEEEAIETHDQLQKENKGKNVQFDMKQVFIFDKASEALDLFNEIAQEVER